MPSVKAATTAAATVGATQALPAVRAVAATAGTTAKSSRPGGTSTSTNDASADRDVTPQPPDRSGGVRAFDLLPANMRLKCYVLRTIAAITKTIGIIICTKAATLVSEQAGFDCCYKYCTVLLWTSDIPNALVNAWQNAQE